MNVYEQARRKGYTDGIMGRETDSGYLPTQWGDVALSAAYYNAFTAGKEYRSENSITITTAPLN